MAKYLMLKHYRGAPAPVNDVPMDRWTPEEVDAHVQFMHDLNSRLVATSEFIDGQGLSPNGMWVRSDGAGKPTVTGEPIHKWLELREFMSAPSSSDV